MDVLKKEKRWMSVGEAAEYLGLSEGRIRQLLLAERIEAMKLNERAWAIPKTALDDFKKLDRPAGNPNFGKS
jgi:excisionase family DNA binding protein